MKVALFPTLDGTRMEITHLVSAIGPNNKEARRQLDQQWMNALEKMRSVIERV